MKSKGFTLIELAVVLAIIAVLAAVLTPMVTGYLDQARIARAQADVRTLADAIKLYQRDTGRWPIFATSGDYTAGTQVFAGGKLLIGGNTGANPADGAQTWGVASNIAAATMESYLNNNLTTMTTTATFPKTGFRGPYLGSLDSDPWNNKYLLTANYLGGTASHAYVISAGPNGVMDTTEQQSVTGQFTIGVDDIVSLIK